MIPDFKLTADTQDVTEMIRSRLISLTLTDETGNTSDTLSLSIVDTPDGLAIPKKDVRLALAIGYRGHLILKGTFTVDEVKLSYPPPKMDISAKSAPMTKTFRAPKNRSWDQITLGNMAGTIAGECGLELKISPELSNILIRHEDQTDESDSSFLNRIVNGYDCVVKPNGSVLLICRKNESKTISGRDMPEIVLNAEEITSWSGALPDRDRYGSCVSVWVDLKNGKEKEVKTGDDKPQYRIRKNFDTEMDAKQAAFDTLKSLNRKNASLSLTLLGNPEICAGSPIVLSNLRNGFNGSWVVKKATHTISSSGFKTSLELDPKPGP